MEKIFEYNFKLECFSTDRFRDLSRVLGGTEDLNELFDIKMVNLKKLYLETAPKIKNTLQPRPEEMKVGINEETGRILFENDFDISYAVGDTKEEGRTIEITATLKKSRKKKGKDKK